MSDNRCLPLPQIFDRTLVESSHSPDGDEIRTAAEEFARKYSVTPSCEDEERTLLLGIDCQNSFTQKRGSLYVAGQSGNGASMDMVRLAMFLYRNMARISKTCWTLDTHSPWSIFYADFWELESGESVSQHTMVRLSPDGELENVLPDGAVVGQCRPKKCLAHVEWPGVQSYEWLVEYCKHYCRALAEGGKYALYLWPHHCDVGSWGGNLNPLVEHAALFHSFACRKTVGYVLKGMSALTERYSAFEDEVLDAMDGAPVGSVDRNTLNEISKRYSRLIVAGEAASHCVASSLDSLIKRGLSPKDGGPKTYVLKDCMSAVVVPGGPDFTPQAEEMFERCEAAGMHVVDSTVPMQDWPE